MKKMMILASAIMMAAAANAKRVETESFNKVMVNVPARVRVVPGDTYSVNIATSDSILAQSLRVNVENGVLNIMPDARLDNRESDSNLRIIIVTPVEPQVMAGRDCMAKTICNTYLSEKKDMAAGK